MKQIKTDVGDRAFDSGKYIDASNIFIDICTSDFFEDFLTIPSYDKLK